MSALGALPTHAPRRQARAAAARLWLEGSAGHGGAAGAIRWHDLATLPPWVLAWQAQADASLHPCLAMAAGSLWHAPALRRCLDASVLQRLAEVVGAPVLTRLLALEEGGPAQALPAEDAGLVPAIRHMGQLLALAALPEAWRSVMARVWGWESVATELATLPVADDGGQRAFQRAERVCAAAWAVIEPEAQPGGDTPPEHPADDGATSPHAGAPAR